MATLCVNIDHVATLRQARRGNDPDPADAVHIVEMGGSTGVTVHLREDQRHIQERDVRIIRQIVKGHLNLEMAATPAMVAKALDLAPDIATLVPERREEITTEGGAGRGGTPGPGSGYHPPPAGGTAPASACLSTPRGSRSMPRCNAAPSRWNSIPGPTPRPAARARQLQELEQLYRISEYAQAQGLIVNAGHGLHYHNTAPVAAIPGMRELNIGHAIVSRAVFDGLRAAVAQMAEMIDRASRSPQTYRPIGF